MFSRWSAHTHITNLLLERSEPRGYQHPNKCKRRRGTTAEAQVRGPDVSCCLCMDTVPNQHLREAFALPRIILLGHLADKLVFPHGSHVWKFWGSLENGSSPGMHLVLSKRSFSMCGHGIVMQPHRRSDACWWHCTYPTHKHHPYDTRTTCSWLSRHLGATKEALCHTCGHLCTQNLLGENMMALNMDLLLSSAERLSHPC